MHVSSVFEQIYGASQPHLARFLFCVIVTHGSIFHMYKKLGRYIEGIFKYPNQTSGDEDNNVWDQKYIGLD